MGVLSVLSRTIEQPSYYQSHSPYGALHQATALFSGMAQVLRQSMPDLVPQHTFQYAQGVYGVNHHLWAMHTSHLPNGDVGALVVASMGWTPELVEGHTPKGSQELRVLLSGDRDPVASASERLDHYLSRTFLFHRVGDTGLFHPTIAGYTFPNEEKGKIWREHDIPDLKPGKPKEDSSRGDGAFGGVTTFN
ncbi:MAG: hypothetical protein Q7S65_03900 [Nanoarchaeota archaeon]|nr:hypothetical protein [Nanoarchaeota archaeon]